MQGVDGLKALGVVIVLDLGDNGWSELLAKFLPSTVWSCSEIQLLAHTPPLLQIGRLPDEADMT